MTAQNNDMPLKPCPFCGSISIADRAAGDWENVCCTNEKCDLWNIYMSPRRWNTRTDTIPDHTALLKQARDAMDEASYICHDHKIRRSLFDTITAIDAVLRGGE